MSNAISKLSLIRIAAAAVITATALGATSCGDSDKKQAEALLEQARADLQDGRYSAGLAILDTLDARFPAQTDARRQGMHLRPQLIERQSLREMESADSLLAVLTLGADSLKATLELVPDAFEGYYTTRKLASKVPADKPGLYARMSTEGTFTVVCSAPKGTLGTGAVLTAGGAEARTPAVAEDGERNDRSRGVEIITFMPVECDTLGHFAALHRGEPIKLTFTGGKERTISLDPDQADALARIYEASRTFGAMRSAQLRKAHMQKQIDVARSQMARTWQENPDSVAR